MSYVLCSIRTVPVIALITLHGTFNASATRVTAVFFIECVPILSKGKSWQQCGNPFAAADLALPMDAAALRNHSA